MTNSTPESQVRAFCQRRRVFTIKQICEACSFAAITIRRVLKSIGYFRSFNHNARYTLANHPRFDAHGLFFHRTIGFSQHRNLTDTLVALVQAAPAGATPGELSTQLQTELSNLLGVLARRDQLARRRLGHHVVSLAIDQERQVQQWTLRLQQQQSQATSLPLPADLQPQQVLAVVTELIQTPKASVAQLTRQLSGRFDMTPLDVQAILDFYQLEKKGAPCR